LETILVIFYKYNNNVYVNVYNTGAVLAALLLCLAPFIDQEGVLRVGGRLRHSSFTNDKKHPILLPKQHHITKLIAKYLHICT